MILTTNVALLSTVLFAFTVMLPLGLDGQPTSVARQRAALQKACAAGAISQDECTQRLAALDAQGQQPSQTAQNIGQGNSQVQGRTTSDNPGYNANNAPIAGSTQYKEPNGRYSMTIPPGWKLEANQAAANLTIRQGEAWAIFSTSYSTQPPLGVIHKEADQMKGMYTSFQPLNDSPFTTQSKHPAAGMTVAAVVPPGKKVVMLYVTQGAGGGNYMTMVSSAPDTQAPQTNGLLMQIFESVRFGGE